ncbi:CYTH domain-containing protein [Echinimonas agarilytica]|uniref:CYTH domain-containing protein n=2 Tax=Echinimonas agarilytica TaxID=1215918 RepID=A0AA41W761_9GAMM|nr:CYTH domain-containing protein [Echinimonas agarilytica]
MDTEIELKLLVASEDLSNLTDWMNCRSELVNFYERELGNIYFDTRDRQLRSMDCGLRVRTVDGRSEQTLKTAGKVIGGLHSRPEYNIPIDGRRPDLFLFERDIWPENTDISTLQNSLQPQFETNFKRKTWLLSFADDAIIEAVLDVGQVSAGDDSLPICEMEFELVKGAPSLLFQFAKELSQHFSIRLGQSSKAARGYRLMDGAPDLSAQPLPVLALDRNTNIEASLVTLVGAAVKHLQTNEDVFVATHDIRALQEVRHGLLWLLQIRHYLSNVLSDESLMPLGLAKPWLLKLGWVSDEMYREQILAEKQRYMKRLDDKPLVRKSLRKGGSETQRLEAQAMFVSAGYSQWFLDLSQWLVCHGWRSEGEAQPELEAPIAELARHVLDHSLQHVKERFPIHESLSAEHYADGCERLERSLLSGNCFRRMFDEDATTGYRGPWHDMLKGCQELALLKFLEQFTVQLELTERKAFERWLHRKRKSWVELVEQSKQSALSMDAYWR